jgi:hypothetical protein
MVCFARRDERCSPASSAIQSKLRTSELMQALPDGTLANTVRTRYLESSCPPKLIDRNVSPRAGG